MSDRLSVRPVGGAAGDDAGTPFPGPIVFVDGGCLLCSRAVAFLGARDRSGRLWFAHLQGPLAARWLPDGAHDAGPEGAVALLEPDGDGYRVSTRSRAVLRALGHLGGPWKLLTPLASVPGVPPALDVLYRYVARNRDRWFGRDECIVPAPALRARFLEAPDTPYDTGTPEGTEPLRGAAPR